MPVPETFTPKTWVDGSGGATPITAAELNRLETGVESMDDRVAAIEDLPNAKGDVITATADNTLARLAVGTNGQVLTASSAASTGLIWATPATVSGVGRVIDVTQSPYSAVGNGSTDDTTALQNAINALTPGDTLIIPAGKTFNHSATLTVGTAGVFIRGGGTLRGTVQATSGILINANNVRVEDLTLTLSSRTGRGSTLDNIKLTVNQVSGAVIRNVTVLSSFGYGMYMRTASDWLIDNCRISNSGADAFHVNGGSSKGRIYNLQVANPEDDGIGLVSDDTDSTDISDIVIRGFKLDGQNLSGRGIGIIGASNVLVEDFHITNSYAAGIIVATETSYLSRANSNIRVRSGVLRGCNTAAPTVNHGAIVVNNSRSTGTTNVDDIIFSDIVCRDTNSSANGTLSTLRSGSDTITNVRYRDIYFEGTGPSSDFRTTGTVGVSYARLWRGDSLITHP